MNKLLIAAAAVFFAATALFGPGAEAAGFNVRLAAPAGFSTLEKAGCGGGGYRIYRKRRHQSVSRRVKRKVNVASKPAASQVAKAEPEKKAEPQNQVAETENSSISTSEGPVAEAKTTEAASEKVAAAAEVGCKKFFPAVGLTLSVSCE